MKISINLIIFSVIFNFISSTALADPSPQIKKLMNTPATAFDVYLFMLYQTHKCFPHKSLAQQDSSYNKMYKYCLSRIEYDWSDNIILMEFSLNEHHPGLKDFYQKSDTEKQELFNKKLNELVMEYGFGKHRGKIHGTQIRYGLKSDDFDEEEFKNEISKRTQIMIFYLGYDGYTYLVKRDHHGNVLFRKDKVELTLKKSSPTD